MFGFGRENKESNKVTSNWNSSLTYEIKETVNEAIETISIDDVEKLPIEEVTEAILNRSSSVDENTKDSTNEIVKEESTNNENTIIKNEGDLIMENRANVTGEELDMLLGRTDDNEEVAQTEVFGNYGESYNEEPVDEMLEALREGASDESMIEEAAVTNAMYGEIEVTDEIDGKVAVVGTGGIGMRKLIQKNLEANREFFGELKAKKNVILDENQVESGIQYMGMDVGSTGIRTAVLLETPEIDDDSCLENAGPVELIAMDSIYAEADENISIIPVRKKDKIYDKLEMKIINNKANAYFTSKHIVRGTLVQCVGNASTKLASSASKIDQEQTYINIISNVALGLLNKELKTTVKMSSIITVDLTVALPSDDLSLKSKLQQFRDNLDGTYTVEFPRLDHTVRFTIYGDSVNVISEAYASSLYIQSSNTDRRYKCEAIIGIGGRSTGNILVINGQPVENKQISTQTGGTTLTRNIGNAVTTRLKTGLISSESAERILKTAMLVKGHQEEDLFELVEEQKENFAKTIFNEYLALLDKNEKNANEIDRVVLVGRIFNPYEREGADELGTLADKVAEIIEGVSESTIVDVSDKVYPIPYGLLEYRLTEI